MPPLFAVFGQPIAHSRSPAIHAAFGRQFGIPIDYRRIETGIDGLADALRVFADAGGVGANLTLPLKDSASGHCHTVSARASRAGSINTLLRRGEGWRGDTTDGIGLLTDLRERHHFQPAGTRVLLVGAGGAARAVAASLLDDGVAELVVANRTRERAEALCDAIDPGGRSRAFGLSDLEGVGRFDLLINATAAGHGGGFPDLPSRLTDDRTLAYDLSYGDAAKPFLAWAGGAGAGRAIDGLGMLVEQAAAAFQLWHRVGPKTEPVYRELRAAIDANR